MNHMLIYLLTLLFSLSGPAMGECSDFSHSPLAAKTTPQLGQKLEYFLGNATGNAHNIQRSTGMLRQLESVGLHDTLATRQYLTEHLSSVVNNANNIVRTQANGTVVRESLLMGPNGGMKFETVWDGTKLITGKLLGGN